MDNKLTYRGKTYGYTDGAESEDKIMSVSAYIGDSIPSVSLPVDTMTAVVLSEERLDQGAQYGADVLYYHGDDLVGRFRLQDIVRIGKDRYRLDCVSAIGLLLTSYHYGGLYTGQTAAEVLADIVGGVVSYTLDDDLGATKIYGLLRKQTRRDNLRDLLFAIGGQVRKDTAGELHIVPMTAGTPYAITADEIYIGGSVTGGNPATEVRVTEHSFMALSTDAVVTLYDGESAAEPMITPKGASVTGVLVEFKQPMHDLSIQNAVMLESGVNYAVISGSPAAVLTGRAYTHTERIVSRRGNSTGTPNIVLSRECTLVNLMNAELVADRLWAYYSAAKTVEADIVVTRQKPGDSVIFTDPFGDETTGYIADMELTMSAILKAKTTIVSGYIPAASGNYYSNVRVIKSSGTWTVPKNCNGKIRVVCIGGGDGGSVGGVGEPGGRGSESSYGTAGKGGLPGTPGSGGKVFSATVPVEPGQQCAVTIGKGGKGQKTAEDNPRGGDTTFGPYTSADGFPPNGGYINLLTGEVYAIRGEEGIPGGMGVGPDDPGERVTYQGVTYVPGDNGANGSYSSATGYGGLGGGAAAGANGCHGEDGSAWYNNGNPFAEGGDGGNGATPVKADNGVIPGQGGGAGHGSGGGGGGGAAKGSASNYQWPGDGGKPGSPGEGGDGADGIVLIYYGKDPSAPEGEHLIFKSDAPFSISVRNKGWDGVLEYFSPNFVWAEWDGTEISASANKGSYIVRLRGSGNTVITGHTFDNGFVMTGGNIRCIGNIETLLDYATVESGAHPEMGRFCFSDLFRGCTGLVNAPELPATTLAYACYHGMFKGCTGLVNAPKLPAMILEEFCYSSMFDGCSNMIQIPALPATDLENFCYDSMFLGCKKLKISEIKNEEYAEVYRIPYAETGFTGMYSLNLMFEDTGGTFAGTPEINTTYYLSSDNEIV